ncbi:MAG: sugar ABC transporter permease [Anaeromicrobium sp.]|uniref:carbohydrate ABC transporter permease n=1 Tax=Anaeromicrobium sp. TaxID=1929132 RepID=UPI0025D983D3|nr:sugar ABC transporter permease [Anaeromicrobium sp.]MCT4595344.1 sugar ABC transporter permease [Anaeromicrobium sp.]
MMEATKIGKDESLKNSFLESDIAVNCMYIPAFILFLIFVAFPFVSGIGISFTNWNGFSQSFQYIGIENYRNLIKDKNFWTAFFNTMIYGVGSTFFQQVLGLSYAIILNEKFKGRTIARTFIYMPVLIAAVIMGYMWYFLVQYDGGAINEILIFLGYEPVDWLANGKIAVWLMVGINVLQFVGVSMVIYLAGLQAIPNMYYEAANVEGATEWQKFRNITLPLLMPAITTSVTLNLIGGLKLFDVIKALTNGGPGYSSHSLSTLINYTYFGNQSAGYASAIGLVLFLFIMIVSMGMQKIFREKEVDYKS